MFSVSTAVSQPGILRMASPLLPADVDNAYQALSMPAIISAIVTFDPLVVIDSNGHVQPWLVTKWTTEESRVWSLTLREGVRFSNGVPLSSEAVRRSVEHIKSAKGRTETVGSSLANIERAEILSEHRIAIYLQEPDPLFPVRMAIWRLPEPETYALSDSDPAAPHAAATGPFLMTEKSEARMVYEANPIAWNPPKAKGLVIVKLPDQTSRLQALSSDAVDIAFQLGVSDREQVESFGGRMERRRTVRVNYLSFATAHFEESPIHDRRVRQALNYAVNKERISNLLLDKTASPLGQLVLPGAPGYVPDLEPYAYDPTRAMVLLREAGYSDGLTLTIRVAAAGADELSVYQQLAQDLQDVNVTLNIRGAALGQMTLMMFAGDFEAEMFANFGRGLDPLGDYRYRSCLGLTGKYKPYFCDPVSLSYIKQARLSTDRDSVDMLMRQVTLLEHENPPGVFLWQGVSLDAISARVTSAESYGDFYDFIPFHTISIGD